MALKTLNLESRSLGAKSYTDFEPVIAPKGAAGMAGALTQVADAMQQQVRQVEDYYEALLRELQQCCRQVSGQAGTLAALEVEHEALLAKLRSLG